MSALIDSKPEYQAVTLMRVDWDQYSDDRIVKELQIPRRSTLVMFSGGKEVGRLVAQSDPNSVKALFEAVTL